MVLNFRSSNRVLILAAGLYDSHLEGCPLNQIMVKHKQKLGYGYSNNMSFFTHTKSLQRLIYPNFTFK